MHLFGADLHLELVSAIAHHPWCEAIGKGWLGDGDEVLDAARHRPPKHVDEAQHAVTVSLVLSDDANGQQIENLIDRDLRLLQLW